MNAIGAKNADQIIRIADEIGRDASATPMERALCEAIAILIADGGDE